MKNMLKNFGFIAIAVIIGLSMTACRGCDNLAHTCSFSNWAETTAPTCISKGIDTGTCSCGKTSRRDGADINPNAHIFSTTPATCTTDSIPGICTREGCVITNPEAVVPALGQHNWNGWEININSISKKTCSRCDGKINGEFGDTGPAGGKIIYISSAGFEVTSTTTAFTTYKAYYLEAAPENAIGGTGMQTTMGWSTRPSLPYLDVTGTGTGIGSGRNNTALIISAEKASYPSDTYIYAALACDNYVSAGDKTFTDWFLPSKDELNQLYTRRADLGLSSGIFWSSSQSNTSINHAWLQSFVNGLDYGGPKGYDSIRNDVRAVRAF